MHFVVICSICFIALSTKIESGTPAYIALEVISRKEYDDKVLRCIFWLVCFVEKY
ncbi:hypothetical protein HanPSC8_Chr16g0700761 [Helianthus annuus]|nr:hypothetical protein HanPSC8_Chr16g0700761 [Helianthus annuus]